MKTTSSIRIFFTICTLCLIGCGKTAKKALNNAQKEYKQAKYEHAIQHYQDYIERGGEKKAMAHFRIAEGYRKSNRIHEALEHYRTAINKGIEAEEAYFYYAFALKANGKYESAKEQFQDYLQKGSNFDYINRAKKEIKNIKEIEDIIKEESYFKVENAEPLNTDGREFSPYPHPKNDKIYFTSSRGEGEMYATDGTRFTDMFYFKPDGTEKFRGPIKKLPKKFNQEAMHEACAVFSPDGKTMIFSRGNDGTRTGRKDVDLFISHYKNGKWTEPKLMDINDPNAWDSTPTYSNDGTTLYFASNREGGVGNIDLYKATKSPGGTWSQVQNMGSTINTKGNELFPYVSDKGNLYFSSDGHPSLGALDIFIAKKDDKGNISVENLGQPINTSHDDFGLAFLEKEKGLFSSNRPGGKGNDDIYRFVDETPEIKEAVYVLEGKTYESKANSEDTKDSLISGVTVKLLNDEGDTLASEITGKNSKFFFNKIKTGKEYTLFATKDGYLKKRMPYSTKDKEVPQEEIEHDGDTITLNTEIVLNRREIGETMELADIFKGYENIYYDFDKANIRPDAAKELNKVVGLMKDNPKIKIELQAHTDERGSDTYNLKLSQRRAQSAVDYIVSRGISRSRIKAKGYGEIDLKIKDAETEEEHQQNRRTEIKIIGIEGMSKKELKQDAATQ